MRSNQDVAGGLVRRGVDQLLRLFYARWAAASRTLACALLLGVALLLTPTLALAVVNVNISFTPSPIPPGGVSHITITLSGSVGESTTAVFTHTFPAGLVVAPTPGISGTCVISKITAAAGASTISYASGASVSTGCTIIVNVTAATSGSYPNIIPIGALQLTSGSNTTTANATLTVVIVPKVQLSKRSLGGTGVFAFTMVGLGNNSDSITTATSGVSVSSGLTSNGSVNVPTTITETGSTAYATAISCVDTNSAISGNPATPITSSTKAVTLPAANMKASAIYSCTFTNSLLPQITLAKTIVSRVLSSDQFTLTMTPGGPSATSSGTAMSATTTLFTGAVGSTYTLSESGPNLSSYSAAYSCNNAYAGSGATAVPPGSGTTFNVTVAAGDMLTCTFTNTPNPPKLTLLKALGGNRMQASDQFTMQIMNGATLMNDTSNSTTSGSGSSVTAGTGTTGLTTLAPAVAYTLTESAAGSTPLASYTGTLSCSNTLSSSTVLPSGSGQAFTLTPQTGDVISCVLTNKVKNISLVVQQIWFNGKSGDAVSIPATSGLPINTALFSSSATGAASNTAQSGAVLVPLGASGTLPNPTFTTGNPANYSVSGYLCSDGVSAFTVAPGGTLTVPSAIAGSTLTCALTNTRLSTSLVLQKSWINGKPGDAVTLAPTTGFANNTATLNSSAAGTASNVSVTAGVTAYVGTVGVLPSESFSSGSAASYSVSGYVCNDGISTLSVAQGGSLTIPVSSAGQTLRCVLTNAMPAPPTVLLSASSVGASGTFGFSLSGLRTSSDGITTAVESSPVFSTQTNIGTIGTAASVTVNAPSVVGYTTQTQCADTNSASTGNTASITSSTTLITIPAANMKASAAYQCSYIFRALSFLTVVATINGRVSITDQFKLAITPGGPIATSSGTVGSVSTSKFTAVASTTYSLGESAAGSSDLANYTLSYSCSNSSTSSSATSIAPGAGASISVTPNAGDNLICTFMDTPTAPVLVFNTVMSGSRLQATDQFTVQVKSGASVVNAVANSTTLGSGSVVTAGSGSSGSTTLVAGDTITLLEIAAGSTLLTNYTGSISCSNSYAGSSGSATLLPAGNGQTFTLTPKVGDSITCTLTNTFTGAPQVRVLATTLNGSGSNIFGFALSGLNALSDSLTIVGAGSASGSTTLNGVIGVSATLSEISPSGWPHDPVGASCVDLNSATPSATFGVLLGAQLSVPGAKMVAGADIRCTFTNSLMLSISGQVFLDNGVGAGIANDGVLNGAEPGQSGVLMQLTDCANSTVLSSATTDMTGQYSLLVPTASAVGASLCVLETNSGVRLSTGASVGALALPSGTPTAAAGGSYTYLRNTLPDRIALLWNGASQTGLNFGDVEVSTLLANGIKTGQSGSGVIYPHTFTAGSSGSVSFSVSNSVATPALTGWDAMIYADPTCSGLLQPGAAILAPPSVAMSVTTAQIVCVLVQQHVAVLGQPGNSNDLTVQASFTFSQAVPAFSASYTVDDVTTVSNSALDLKKEVRNVTQSGTFGVNNQAKSGETLEYRITYSNNGVGPISNLMINDATPPFTTFISSGTGSTPTGLSVCVKNTPSNPLPALALACTTLQTSGGTGPVNWQFTGPLNPGDTGRVLFMIKVN